MKKPGPDNKIELVKVTLPPEEQRTRPKRWRSLLEAVGDHVHIEGPFKTCQRRGLEVVINTVEDGRVVVAIDGHVGVGKGLITALRRAASAWDKATKPKGGQRKRR